MGKVHKHAELIKAWVDGADIEFFQVETGRWEFCVMDPYWACDAKYRIKPKAKLPELPPSRILFPGGQLQSWVAEYGRQCFDAGVAYANKIR